MNSPLSLPPRDLVVHRLRWAFLPALLVLAGFSLPRTVSVFDPPIPTPELWLTDRDGGLVVGLDRDLLVVAKHKLSWPIEIEACVGGGYWVTRSVDGAPFGVHQLLEHDAAGTLVSSTELGQPFDMHSGDGLHLALVEHVLASGERRVLWGPQGGSLAELATLPGATCCASRGSVVLVGADGGALHRLERASDGTLQTSSFPTWGGEILDLAIGQEEDWWILHRQGAETRLALVDEALEKRWEVPTGISPLHLAPQPEREGCWVVDANEPHARRFGPGGVSEVVAPDLPHGGLDRALPWFKDGLLCVAPGALLHLTQGGELAPGQGGFNFLVDLDSASRYSN